MSQPLTAKFDTNMCSDTRVMNTYKEACDNKSECLQNLSQYCQTNIYTTKDFNMKANLLSCYVTCKKGENSDKEICFQKCAKTLQ